jgi:hypothetical protein
VNTIPVKLTDTDKLRIILMEFPNVWLSHNGILGRFQNKYGHGATIHSRAATLRKQGYQVDCRITTVKGRKFSWYRIVTS